MASPYRARASRPPLRGGEYDAFKFRPNSNIIDIWLRRSRAKPFVGLFPFPLQHTSLPHHTLTLLFDAAGHIEGISLHKFHQEEFN